MPVIAKSPPIVFRPGGGGATPQPTQTPPPATPSPPPVRTPAPPPAGTPQPGQSAFVKRHEVFIRTIDSKPACFKKESISGFSKQEIEDHLKVAMIDRYVAQSSDQYCTMKGVRALSTALKRLGE